MDEGFMFLLGFCLGSLMMLFAVVRIIIEMHDRMELNLRRR
ncbi:MAG: hypothetical protein ACP5NU_03035 [Methanomicrobiales archaeon]|jgi:hypothetical protein|nr:MAG: hypothetical protein A4E39_00500 [Methanoregulaceae archaeon PtaB.Bin152]OPY40141.1 MAG: hypothetical protein A4E40_00904 [Methanoregulaceae archaeon PtaU1.Bin059]HOB59615.1 hypothetical protein [Methanoregulaceae archaeon]HQM55921.1 hypothetical protein [Methanoregulaceae archaeon]HQP83251.1 hypothetical protein [Methanoregulaceae archaeon]